MFTVEKSGQGFGASIRGIKLNREMPAKTVAALREAWLEHHVLAFPEQTLSDDDLERFTQYFGGFGHDPFIAPIAGRQHVIAISRRADEKAPLFAENWHSDWAFRPSRPQAPASTVRSFRPWGAIRCLRISTPPSKLYPRTSRPFTRA